MVRTVGGLALVGALLCGGVLAGCSGPQPARTQRSTGSSGTSAHSSAERASTTGSSRGSEAGTPGTAPAKRLTGTTTGRPVGPSDLGRSIPVLNPAPVAAIGYGPASSQGLSRLEPAHMASAHLLVTYAVSTLRVGGRDVGAVGIYRTKPGMTTTTLFERQYVVQLINAVTGSRTSPRFVLVGGSVMALSTGPVPVAGWFRNGQVVLVYRNGTSPDLAALASGVQATPPPA